MNARLLANAAQHQTIEHSWYQDSPAPALVQVVLGRAVEAENPWWLVLWIGALTACTASVMVRCWMVGAISPWEGLFLLLVLLVLSATTAARLWSQHRLLRRRLDRLAVQLEQEQIAARTDALTGLPNRRAFQEELEVRADPTCFTPFDLLYLDLDCFKQVNDRYGHEEGDGALRLVAAMLLSLPQRPAFLARLGGDEFVLILEPGGPARSDDVSAWIRAGMATLAAGWPEAGLGVSIGRTCCATPSTADRALEEADQDMYHQKRQRPTRG